MWRVGLPLYISEGAGVASRSGLVSLRHSLTFTVRVRIPRFIQSDDIVVRARQRHLVVECFFGAGRHLKESSAHGCQM